MDTFQALEIIKNAVEKAVGKEKANEAFSAILSSFIYELQSSNQPINSETLTKAIIEEAEFCLKCLAKDAA